MKLVFKVYLYFLALAYTTGAIIHLFDVINWSQFLSMSYVWQGWIVYLLIADSVAAIGLWKNKSYGQRVFLLIAFSQLIAYSMFVDIFGKQSFLIRFHIVSVLGYFILNFVKNKTHHLKER